jgi:carbon-monoxide dehydrogenase medium subunit
MRFEAHIPATLEDALVLLGKHAGEARVVAGGTDLFILMKSGMTTPGHLVSIGGLKQLKSVSDRNGVISIGAGLTHAVISGLPVLQEIPCLIQAARSVGSPQVRNAGTLGGNLANASPAADLYPPLLALDARVEIFRDGGERTVDLASFVTGPGVSALAPGEIISRVFFSKPEGDFFCAHSKIGLRNALAVSVTSAAVAVGADAGRLRNVRIACGAVAPIPLRMRKAESLLEGEAPTKGLLEEAGAVASSECDPISDIRATRQYRCHATGINVSRLLKQACAALLGYADE